MFLRKLVGIYNSKRFPYDVLVVVNIFVCVEVLRETHPAMSCHFFCLLVLFFVLFFVYFMLYSASFMLYSVRMVLVVSQ